MNSMIWILLGFLSGIIFSVVMILFIAIKFNNR